MCECALIAAAIDGVREAVGIGLTTVACAVLMHRWMPGWRR